MAIRVVRFGAVGGTVIVFFILLNGVLGRGFGLAPQLAFLAAYPPALALHFCLCKAWTFQDPRPTRVRHVGDYVFAALVIFLIQWPVFTVLQTGFRLPGEIAAGGANLLQMVASYLFLRSLVFGVAAGSNDCSRGAWTRLLLLVATLGGAAVIAWTALERWELPKIGPKQLDYFNLQLSGFQKGSLALDIEVPEALKKIVNPWDPANRPPGLGRHDVSYYNGHYYSYFGVAPVVLVFWPFKLLSGSELPLQDAAAGLGVGAFLIAAWLWLQVLRDHFPKASLLTKLAGVLALGTVGGQLTLARRVSLWEPPISAGHFFLIACVASAYLALRAKRPWGWLAASSVFLGFSVGSRPTLAVAGCGLVCLILFIASRSFAIDGWKGFLRRAILSSLAAGIPLGVVMAGLFAYNYARFGNLVEFGLNYQLTSNYEAKARHFSLAYVPYNWAVYFTEAPQWGRYFPFLHPIADRLKRADGYYGIEYVYGAGIVCPIIWWAIFVPGCLLERRRREVAALVGILLGIALSTTALLLCFNTAAARYVVDFRPWWIWLALLGWAWLEAKIGGRFSAAGRFLIRSLFAACLAFSCAIQFFESVALHNVLRIHNPAAYFGLARVFDRPVAWVERHLGSSTGPVEMDVSFPQTPSGSVEPLLVTGVSYETDYFLVEYESPPFVKLGYWGPDEPIVWTDPLAVEPGKPVHLRLESGSLYPPRGHPIYDGWPDAEIRSVTDWVTIRVNDRSVLFRAHAAPESSPDSIQIGVDRRMGIAGRKFAGSIANVRRMGIERHLHSVASEGDIILNFELPAILTSDVQPLVVAGRTGHADLIGLRLLDTERFALEYESWGAGIWESQPIRIPAGRFFSLRVRLGSLMDPRETSPASILRNSIVVWLDGEPVWWRHTLVPLDPHPPLELAVNSIGSSAMIPYFQGRLLSTSRGPVPGAWRRGPFRSLEMLLGGEGAGTEPLLATGTPGRADTFSIEWMGGGRARFLYYHWGFPIRTSEPFVWDSNRIHALRIELPSLRNLDAHPAPESCSGRLRILLDGAMIWEVQVPFYPADSKSTAVGRNSAGASNTEPELRGVVADVEQSWEER